MCENWVNENISCVPLSHTYIVEEVNNYISVLRRESWKPLEIILTVGIDPSTLLCGDTRKASRAPSRYLSLRNMSFSFIMLFARNFIPVRNNFFKHFLSLETFSIAHTCLDGHLERKKKRENMRRARLHQSK